MNDFKKIAFFAALASMARPITSLVGGALKWHAVGAGVSGVLGGMSAPGDFKQKVREGTSSFFGTLLDPKQLAVSTLAFGVVPAVGARAMNTLGKGILQKNQNSALGRFLYKTDTVGSQAMGKTVLKPGEAGYMGQLNQNYSDIAKTRTIGGDYLGGGRAGVLPSLGIGMGSSAVLTPTLFGADQSETSKALTKFYGDSGIDSGVK